MTMLLLALYSLGMILPFMPGTNPWLWAISTVCMFSLLSFLTSHCYSVSIFSIVNSKAVSTIPSPVSVLCFADVSDQKRTFGDLCLSFLLGWERDKRTGLICTALIWFPKREIPFHLMHPYRPKQCSCAVELTLEDTAELHRGASCMGLPMTVLSHCFFSHQSQKDAASPLDTTLRSLLVLAWKGNELSVLKHKTS